jgi:hypothetical protein
VVAAVLPNTHPHVEAHFGVPACGAVLNSINIRLDVGTISYILDHGEAKIVLCDTQFLGTVEAALKEMEAEDLPLIVEVPDEGAGYHASGRHMTYEQLLAEGDPDFQWIMPEDEWESDRAQLHLRHHRAAQGRGLSPPGRLPDHHGHADLVADDALPHLPDHRAALSTATTGATPGPCPPWAARPSAAATSPRRRSTTPSPTRA